ncbi:hypothetical protein B0H17DRAFT_1125191 [Mycena rosella]|uniref:Uncharacterized protein n=1 Tax=Mycena rosella TaxID=1033263 RepID=A0AAD7GXP6_MYCRO|nr:hypothetical protein B0H17DRAFT_1125191 [Mycena rosella]
MCGSHKLCGGFQVKLYAHEFVDMGAGVGGFGGLEFDEKCPPVAVLRCTHWRGTPQTCAPTTVFTEACTGQSSPKQLFAALAHSGRLSRELGGSSSATLSIRHPHSFSTATVSCSADGHPHKKSEAGLSLDNMRPWKLAAKLDNLGDSSEGSRVLQQRPLQAKLEGGTVGSGGVRRM